MPLPSADEILDLPCYASLNDYGDSVDLSVIAVPAALTVKAIRGGSDVSKIEIVRGDITTQAVEFCNRSKEHLRQVINRRCCLCPYQCRGECQTL